MHPFARLLPLICACVAIQACATRPAPSPATDRYASPPASSAGTTAAGAAATASEPSVAPGAAAASTQSTSAPVAHRIVLEDKTLTNDEVKQLFAQGYKPVGRNGEVFYCRSEAQTGSRFASMTCKTADQIKQIQQLSKDMLTTQQKTSGCAANRAGC